MRSVKFLVAAGAASLLSSAAFAADMPIAPPPQYYAPPPVADFGGWYLRGDIGFSNQRVKNIAMADGRNASLASLNQSTAFDSAGIFGIGVGYQFNNWFRGDITGQYRGNSNFKGTDRITGYASDAALYNGINDYSATKSEWLVLANAYVDLGTWWCVTPFIGAGVGMARVNIANYTDTGAIDVFDAGGGNVLRNVGPFPSYASAPSASRWNFAWAAHAGLAYQVNPGLTIELAYSYVNLGSGTTGAVSDYTGFTRGVPMRFHDITSQDVKLGVRWNFNSPPVYAPPPLVTKG
jgi:opacity protein-like surface antigen